MRFVQLRLRRSRLRRVDSALQFRVHGDTCRKYIELNNYLHEEISHLSYSYSVSIFGEVRPSVNTLNKMYLANL